MANNVISFNGIHGNNYDLYIGSSGNLWNGSSFIAISNFSWNSFAISGTEQDTTGIFIWNIPGNLPSGSDYSFTIRQRITTGNPLPSDPVDGEESYSWDGTNLGYSLISTGIDRIIVEPAAGSVPSINARQSLGLIFDSSVYGQLQNANTSPTTILNPAGTIPRVLIFQDQFGNRNNIEIVNIP